MKKLSAHYPVFFARFAAHALELPRVEQEEVNGWVLAASFDVGLVWHSDDCRFALGVLEHIEFYIGYVLSIWIAFALPNWPGLLTFKAVLVKSLDKLDE